MTGARDPRRRAERLLWWYPVRWRHRYGEEFVELLIADIDERPRSWRRSADVVLSGTRSRLAGAGLVADPLDPQAQTCRSLASFGAAAAGFLGFGLAMWSQLNIGWRWSRPDTTATFAALELMTVGLAALLITLLAAAAPICWGVAARFAHRRGEGIIWPTALLAVGVVVLVVGAHHFQNGWPGTGGHRWAYQRVIPGGVAAFVWSSTVSVTSYWAHPAALGAFPASEIAWMAVSPLACVTAVGGAVTTVRRVGLRPEALRFEAGVLRMGAGALAVVFLGALIWVVDGTPGPANLFHAGSIDVVSLAAMVATGLVAARAASMAVRASMVTRR